MVRRVGEALEVPWGRRKEGFMEERGPGHAGQAGLEMLGKGKSFLGRKEVLRKGPKMSRNVSPDLFGLVSLTRGTVPGHRGVGSCVPTTPLVGLAFSKSNQACLRETILSPGRTHSFLKPPMRGRGVWSPAKTSPFRGGRHPISPARRPGKSLGLEDSRQKGRGHEGGPRTCWTVSRGVVHKDSMMW